MLNRTAQAHTIARRIEQFEQCPVLSHDSIQFIERVLTDYAVDRLQDVRSSIVNTMMNAGTKTRIVSVLDTAIHAEVTQ